MHRKVSRMYICLVLCLLFTIGATVSLAAPIEVDIWGNANHLEALKPIIERFNSEQQQIVVTIPGKTESHTNIMTAAAGGVLPAIIETAGTITPLYAPLGLIVPLDDFLKKMGGDYIRDFLPVGMEGNIYEGKVFSLPAFLQIEGGYYNKEILQKYGLAPPKPGWTWSDLEQLAKQARQYGPDGSKTVHGIIANGPINFDVVLLGQSGAKLVDDKYRVLVNSEPVQSTYRWILDWRANDLLAYRRGIDDIADDEYAYRAAFVMDASYRQFFWDSVEAPMVTAPPLRRDANSLPSTVFTNRGWAIMKTTPEKEAAALVGVQYLLRPEIVAEWAIRLNNPPSTYSAINLPAYRNHYRDNVNMNIWINSYTIINNSGFPWPSAFEASNIRSAYEAETIALLKGQKTLPQYTEDLSVRIAAMITDFLAGR